MNPQFFLIGLLAAFLFFGCERSKPIPPPHPTHDIVVQDGIIYFNGEVVPLGSSLAEVEKVLGKASVKSYSWWNWDEDGFSVAGEKKLQRIDCMRVTLEKTYDWESEKPFVGRLLVEGAHVTADSSVTEINRKFKGKCQELPGFNETGLPGSLGCTASNLDYELKPSRKRRKGIWGMNFCLRPMVK